MYRVSVKVEQLPVAVRRTPQTEESTPVLLVQARGRTPEIAMDTVLRILTGERNAIEEAKPITTKMSELEDEEGDDI